MIRYRKIPGEHKVSKGGSVYEVVGQGLNRVDAYGKVTGEAKYSADLEPRDILHGKGDPFYHCKWSCKKL